MFEKTLTDVVKGIRASKRDTALYISQCIAEIKNEIHSNDMFVKANALQKLTFLQMMGYSMGYASFATIEVMSSPKFSHKRIGYLAASQGFKQETEVILLSTNLLKKELRCAVGGGMNLVYEAGLAINCVSNIITEDLARDLLPELTNLTTHPQPYLRKKAILCLFKLFVKYPQGLRLTFDRIQQCLEDNNSSVVSCAVNVITELSDKNPKNYLHLAPQFFRLLTNSSNNWMLIKVVKLLGSLVPEEPRLARKLLDPLAEIVRNTQAKSLLYEAVRTITLCLPYCRKADGSMPPNAADIVDLCARTLRDFVEQTDQNLKYLGLVGFGTLMQSHPRVLSAPNYRPLILACFSDQDVTIRNRALDLMPGMASRKNLIELVSQLLKHVELAVGVYKHNLVAKIIEICSSDKYELLQDFSWYLDILLQLGHMRGIESLGFLLRAQVMDVALRVLPVRPYAVRRCMEVLLEREGSGSDNLYGDNGRGKHMMSHILPAIAWIIGEYSDLIRDAMAIDPEEGHVEFSYQDRSVGTYDALVHCLLDPRKSENVSAHTKKIYVQASMKILAAAAADKEVAPIELEAIIATMKISLPVFIQSTDVAVMERSMVAISLLQSLDIVTGVKNGNTTVLNQSQNGDLLGVVDSTMQPKSIKNDTPSVLLGKSTCATLNYLLKPSPMKPCGAKAQRKKRQSPNGVNIDMDANADVTIFVELLSKETKLQRGRKVVLESISFTQQQPMKFEDRSLDSFDTTTLNPKGSGVSNDAFASFQKSGTTLAGPPGRQDPFYLASTPNFDMDDEERRNQSRFGTIQLLDSDNENEDAAPSKEKKKKKGKKGKKSRSTAPSDSDIHRQKSRSSVMVTNEFAIYESDNEDDDVGKERYMVGKRKPGKEFEGLAKVDLTTPLRDDEIMPERKHRVVPDRPTTQRVELTSTKTREKKLKKSKKKQSKNDTVGDLLDLGGDFSTDANPESIRISNKVTASNNNPINLAFDDLLGLSSTSAMPPQQLDSANLLNSTFLGDEVNNSTALNSKSESLWVKGTVKSKGDNSLSNALILFQLDDEIGSNRSDKFFLSFRIQNASSDILNAVSLDIKGYGIVSIGNVAPSGSFESERVGPFTLLPFIDKAQEMKGSISANGKTHSLKLHIPVTYHLVAENNLTFDSIAQELSSPGWFSQSVTINLSTVEDPEKVKERLRNFCHAGLVLGSITKPTTGTYAARSSVNERCRFLFKVREDSVKVDIKTTKDDLGKAVAADLKRIYM